MNYKIVLCIILCMILLACKTEQQYTEKTQEEKNIPKPNEFKQTQQRMLENMSNQNQDGMEMWGGPSFIEPDSVDTYLGFVNAGDTNTWKYVNSYFMTEEPGNDYEQGAFCRIFKTTEGYDFIYGGTFRGKEYEHEYQGVLYQKLNENFEVLSGPIKFSENGGDLAIDSDGEYYYLLGGGPSYKGEKKSWRITKYDIDFKFVKEMQIPLSLGHQTNDQMIRVVNNKITVSGLYVPGVEGITLHADEEAYTHVWVLDKELNLISDKILNESYNINGETIIYYDGKYTHVSSNNYHGENLLAMIYDSEWNYIETKEIEEGAHWSMGAVYVDNLIYVAYEKTNISNSNIFVNIYDTEWNLIEQLQVTDVPEPAINSQNKLEPNKPVYVGNRPWIQIYDNNMLISYDISRQILDKDGEYLSLVCLLSVYNAE